MSRIAVFGAGYVGLVTGACFADLGHEVVVRDVVPERIDALRAGRVPIHEPGLDDVIARRASGFASRSTWARRSTAPSSRSSPSARRRRTPATPTCPSVWTVVDELPAGTRDDARHEEHRAARHGREGARGRSTPAGWAVSATSRTRSSSPRAPAVRDFMHPDRIVIGAFEPRPMADAQRRCSRAARRDDRAARDVASAEMIKLASNALLSTRISFINEIASVCELVGADVVDVAHGIGLDQRLGPHFLKAGLGFGGSCFPKDVSALKQLAGNSGYHFQLLSAVIEVNELQKRRVIQKLQTHLGDLHGKAIALLGLAFKPGTRTTCARRRASSSPRGSSPRVRRCVPGIPWRMRGSCCRTSRSTRRARGRAPARTRP